MPLEDYKDFVGTTASITTIGQMFSGVFICRDIVKQGSTKNIAVTPFLGGVVIGLLMLEYANILNDPAMIRVNICGLILNVGYLLCYYIYTNEKVAVLMNLLYGAIFTGAILGYARFESPDVLEHRFGILITVLLLLLIGAPLFSLGEIIRTKSTATLPFPLIASGTLVTFQWLLYGIIIKNKFIQFQNAVGFSLSAFQLLLFAIYPSKPKDEKAVKTKPKDLKKKE